MARYWTDGYKDNEAVGNVPKYEVTLEDVARWDSKQSAITLDPTPTIGSSNHVTSGAVYNALENMRNHVEKNSVNAMYIDIVLLDDGVYALKNNTYEGIKELLTAGKQVILHCINTGEIAYLCAHYESSITWSTECLDAEYVVKYFTIDNTSWISTHTKQFPSMPDWTKSDNKPTYTYEEVGADQHGEAVARVVGHNTDDAAHADIREAIANVAQHANRIEQNMGSITGSATLNTDAKGTVISLKDSAEAPLNSIRVYGKTTQKSIPRPESPQDYISVGDNGSIEVKLTGRNVFNISKVTNNRYGNLINNGDGTLTVSGSARSGSAPNTLKDYCPSLSIGDIVTFSFVTQDFSNQNIYLDGSGVNWSSGTSKTITQQMLDSVILWYGQSSGTILSNIQFKYGTESTVWEPYKELQTLTIPLLNGLAGIPVSSGGNVTIDGQQYVADYIEMNADGSGKLYKYSWEKECDGSENNWEFITSIAGFRINALPESVNARAGFCNVYEVSNSFKEGAIRLGADNNVIYFPYSPHYDDSLSDKGLANFKAHLTENPIKILTYVTTTTVTDLTAEEVQAFLALHTNNPTTVITNSDDVYMEVGYKADTKHYIDRKFDELATALIANS